MAKTKVTVPPNLIEEILKRLPAKALGRFKCLSKRWKTLISSVRFINNHIDFCSRLSREKLIVLAFDLHRYTVDLVDLKNDNVSALMATQVRFVPRYLDSDDSCNGLIAATLYDATITSLLVNPTTGEFTEVFNRNVLLPKGHSVHYVDVSGFGYDSSTDDYKFFSIIQCCVENVGGKPERFVVVHSLKRNSLRMDIKPPDYHYPDCGYLKSVYLHGCTHWLCDEGSCSPLFIALFDLQEEEFKEMGVPQCEVAISCNPLLVVSGCLCVFGFTTCADPFSMEMWLMKE